MREYVAIFWQFDRLSDINKPGIFICCLLVSTTWINTFINFHSTIHSFVNFTQHSQLNSFWSNYLDSSYLLYNWMAERKCATQNKKNRINSATQLHIHFRQIRAYLLFPATQFQVVITIFTLYIDWWPS